MAITMKEALMKAGKLESVKCQYCGSKAELVTGLVIYPHRPDLASSKFWQCKPCDAFVGCHKPTFYNKFDTTMPLGVLANKQLRRAKSEAHGVFDKIWTSGLKTRGEAYAWLATQLGIDKDDCHIGMFDVNTCNKVVEISKRYWVKS